MVRFLGVTPGGGYVVATAEAVAPATPMACLRAAVQAVKDFGVYGRDLSPNPEPYLP